MSSSDQPEKIFASFLPAATHGAAESERHYLQVHVPLARRELGSVGAIRHYAAYKATDQLDAFGTFARRPAVWRYAMQRLDATIAGDWLPQSVADRLSDDHPLCLSRLRRCDVAETVHLDRLSGQTAFATYLVDVERMEAADAGEAWALTERLVERMAERAVEMGGIRRLAANRVVRETEAEPMAEPGQLLTDRFVEDSSKVAFLEVVADGRPFGDALFADPAVDEALVALKPFAEATCVAVEELCGFDRR